MFSGISQFRKVNLIRGKCETELVWCEGMLLAEHGDGRVDQPGRRISMLYDYVPVWG